MSIRVPGNFIPVPSDLANKIDEAVTNGSLPNIDQDIIDGGISNGILPKYVSEKESDCCETNCVLPLEYYEILRYYYNSKKCPEEVKFVLKEILASTKRISRKSKDWHHKIALFDLDGTILDFHPYGVGQLGKVKNGFSKVYLYLRSRGYRIGILTGRPNTDSNVIMRHLHTFGYDFDFIQHDYETPIKDWGYSNKPIADVYTDDNCFKFTGDWETSFINFQRYIESIEPTHD